jgi:hypothetical protein
MGDFLKRERLRRTKERKPEFIFINEDFRDESNEEISRF